MILDDPAILDTHVCAQNGAIRWANLIVATGHNNLAIETERPPGEPARAR